MLVVDSGMYMHVASQCSDPPPMQGAEQQGAKLLTGGGIPSDLPKGFYVEPTVFTDVTPDMTIWKEEVFGPVLAVATFSDEAEAIRLANQSDYGLAACVMSKDEEVSESTAGTNVHQIPIPVMR